MKERAIIFGADSVRAILDGRKTQTRRLVKPQKPEAAYIDSVEPHEHYPGEWVPRKGGECQISIECPYGVLGDQLWVRETWDFLPDGGPNEPNNAMIRYWAGGDMEHRSAPPDFNPMIYGHEKTRSPMFMPRWASRISLEITDIRVERLQDISEDDARAEGIEPNWIGPLDKGPNGTGTEGWLGDSWRHYTNGEPAYSPIESYRSLWDSINGKKHPWGSNPWVWCLTFRRA